jgi:hypothetical protein
MPGSKRYTPKQVIEALHECKGMMYLTAQRLGCDPDTVQNYCKRYPRVMAVKKSYQGRLVDTAELKLWQAVNNGDLHAAMFVLRTLGRDRGYGEKTEITGKDGGPIQHAHIHVWQERLQAAHNALEARKTAILAIEADHGPAHTA